MSDVHIGADYVRVEVRVGDRIKVVELTAVGDKKIDFQLGLTRDVTESRGQKVTSGGGEIQLCAHGPKLNGGGSKSTPDRQWRKLT